MIYETLKECLEECGRTGTLKAEGMTSDEYTERKLGFRIRLLKD